MKGLKAIVVLLAVALLCSGCEGNCGKQKEKKYDKVLILYQAGRNSLSEELQADINELKQGDLPAAGDNKAIVIISHQPTSYGLYGIKTKPCIIRLYKDKKGLPVLDTLMRLGESDLLTKKEVMSRSLNYVAETFKSDHYGLILGSHGNGWLPVDYFAHPDKYKVSAGGTGAKAAPRITFPTGPVPFEETEPLPGPKVRSFAEERVNEGGTLYVYEMDIKDLAAGLPFHFDYILMDVCLMGCVEVAYELKDKCDRIGFSPTEILSFGLDYSKVTARLLKDGDPDIQGVMDDYFDSYSAMSGDYQSACYSLIDCSKLDALASACRTAFEEGRAAIAAVKPSAVQPFFRASRHWFYDLKDILDKAGAGSSAVDRALEQCVIYEVHTQAFMPHSSGFVFRAFCGLSMYLPNDGSAYLDAYYKTLAWNKATSLVQ